MSPGDMETDSKTFRGRTLEAVLPQIKRELGPDAIVLRRREGLAGGVGGFFQRSFVEVEARGPLPCESRLETRNDRATAEGLRAPAIQALVEQAAPFADALARADESVAERASDVLLSAARGGAVATAPARARAGLYGPQPNLAPEPGAEDDVAEVLARSEPPRYDATGSQELGGPGIPPARLVAPGRHATSVAEVPVAPGRHGAPVAEVLVAPPVAPGRPAAADAAEQRLVASG
ncbi:MAG: hypothetical protein ACR2L8_14310, partial [Solirubrobacteraceae bacterium]